MMKWIVACAIVGASCAQSKNVSKPSAGALDSGALDSDGDGIEDSVDQCPKVAATSSPSGCPLRSTDVICDVTPFPILSSIEFAANARTPTERQAPILDALAATMKGNEELTQLEIRGHLAPGEAAPLALERARFVQEQLQSRGIARVRLLLRDLGSECDDSSVGRVDVRPLQYADENISYETRCERWGGQERGTQAPCRGIP